MIEREYIEARSRDYAKRADRFKLEVVRPVDKLAAFLAGPWASSALATGWLIVALALVFA